MSLQIRTMLVVLHLESAYRPHFPHDGPLQFWVAAILGVNQSGGAVNNAGEILGYKNLYVADGAIIPRPLGVNPSQTISALAKGIADRIPVSFGNVQSQL